MKKKRTDLGKLTIEASEGLRTHMERGDKWGTTVEEEERKERRERYEEFDFLGLYPNSRLMNIASLLIVDIASWRIRAKERGPQSGPYSTKNGLLRCKRVNSGFLRIFFIFIFCKCPIIPGKETIQNC